MSKKRTMKQMLTQAQESEREYEWSQAADFYTRIQADALGSKDFLKAGEMQEKAGFCFRQAAFQADSTEEFYKSLQAAIHAYEEANRIYEKLLKNQKVARKLRCSSNIKYLNYWATTNPEEKRNILDECLELESKALAEFWKSEDVLECARTYNDLYAVFYCRVFLESDPQTLKKIIKQGLEWGERIAEKLSDADNSRELAWTYFTIAICLSDAGFYLTAESEDIDVCRLKADDLLKKAVGLSEKIDDSLLLGLSYLWRGINTGGDEATRYQEKALEYGEKTGDNFLIAHCFDYLAYQMYWKALATEDPDERIALTNQAMEFYEKGQHHYRLFSFMSPRGGVIGPPSGQAEHFHQLSLWETNSKKRLHLLETAEELGKEALKAANESEMPLVIAQVHHVVSKTFQAQAYAVRGTREKKNRLEKALRYREQTVEIFGCLTPFFYWNRGVMQNYLAGIQAELAELAPDLRSKTRLLETAVINIEECLNLCNTVMPSFERKGETVLFAALRRYQDTYATFLLRLYDLTRDPGYLKKAVAALRDAIKSASKVDLISLVAESYWKIAKVQDELGEHLKATASFEQASESYLKAAEKIPVLKDFYRDYATYMKAWSEIERAWIHHAKREYDQAKIHYANAASLHDSTSRWKYFSLNYMAWARLEEAEDLSRGEQIFEALSAFQKAATLFVETKKILLEAMQRIEDADEKDLTQRLIKASTIREEYCRGRIALEEAKILGGKGDHDASSEKYGVAADSFKRLLKSVEGEKSFSKATIVKDRQELMPIIILCQAWRMMARAEAEASPSLYLEASKLFEEAKESSDDEKTRLLALGHSYFCKALDAGARFEETRDLQFHLSATQHLENAANFYVRANFKTAAEYTTATQRLFDAYVYISNANKETDPAKKARFYMAAEKVLQISMGAYMKSKHPAKSEQVHQILNNVRKERELALSLTEILVAPTITSSTTSFAIPSPSEEAAVGLERFEHANIQANLNLTQRETQLGDKIEALIQIANIGKQSVLLAKIEGATPGGFQLVEKPEYSFPENKHLNMKGKKLDPLKTEEVRLVLRAMRRGTQEFAPKIMYVDNTGNQLTSRLEPITVTTTQTTFPDRVPTGYESADDLLLGGIPEGYAVALTSPATDERDRLTRRFLETGIKTGQITFLVSTGAFDTNALTPETQKNFYHFICNPSADVITTSRPNIYRIRGIENLLDINIALNSALRKLGPTDKNPRRCCIQIVSDVLLQHKAIQTRRWLTRLLTELRAKGFTTLTVMDLGMHSPQETRAVLDLFEGEINIYDKPRAKGKGRYIAVRRMVGKEYLEAEMPLT